MWKDYSSSYIKNNRASSVSVKIAALIAASLLSLLCSLFYNLWIYEIERIKIEEGDWQGRIAGELDTETLSYIQNYGNVEKVVKNEELSDGNETVADIYFIHPESILTDMPRIAELTGLPADSVTYHHSLLNMYLIRDPDDPALRWVFPFSLIILAAACLSLILVIHNAFAVTMNARIHQFGIFSSIGATPGQIRTCLLQEAFALCAIPIIAGNLLGILISMGIVKGTNLLLADVERRLVLPFRYHPALFLLSLVAAICTVCISAWIPARKMSKLTPLEAVKNTGELHLKRKRNSHILSFLFGIEGELAGNALKAQKKSMRTATLSLTFSFLAFSLMMCFFTIMTVSQQETYFARYQDAWDVMATIDDLEIDAFEETDSLQALPGTESCVVYQKASARRLIKEAELSSEMLTAGGFEHASAEYVASAENAWLVNAPLMILDDASFLAYCEQIQAKPRLDGAVVLNQIQDASDPNFRKRRKLPYLTGDGQTTLLTSALSLTDISKAPQAELPVLAYTQETPILREEYGTLDLYELVHFIPVSLWKEIKGQIGNSENITYIRILAENEAPHSQETDRVSSEKLNMIEAQVSSLLGQKYEATIENRIQDKINNDRMIRGMETILSIFCILLAVIGIGNVFSNTLGFIRQRRREFARYLSIGLTPEEMKRIFYIEALVTAGRPVLITLPVTAAAVAFFIKLSYLDPAVFLRDTPFLPMLLFILAIFGSVALAYYLGAKRVLRSSLADSLRDDTVI